MEEGVDLKSYLETELGRTLGQKELAVSIGVSTSTFKRRAGEGFQVSEVLAALDYFHLSRTAGLLSLGVIESRDAKEALASEGVLIENTSTWRLAEILAERLRKEEG